MCSAYGELTLDRPRAGLPTGFLPPAQPTAVPTPCVCVAGVGEGGQKPAAQSQPPLAHLYPAPVITGTLWSGAWARAEVGEWV